MRVLLIEDDELISQGIEWALRRRRFNVCATNRGENGIELATRYNYEIIVLDLGLPDMNGKDVVRALRRVQNDTPILVLSGARTIDSKVGCFDAGADEYLEKPFNARELVARIIAIVRRKHGHAQSIISTGRLQVDLNTMTAKVDDHSLILSKREFAVLELLAMRKGSVLSKDDFMDHIYDGIDDPIRKIIDVFVRKLRVKIAAATGGEHYIKTEYGRGFVLCEPEISTNAA